MTTDTPKLVLISGASRMGKSTFADNMLERYAEQRFRYLSYDAIKDAFIDTGVYRNDELKISSTKQRYPNSDRVKYFAPEPEAFVRASKERDEKVFPFMERWAASEMARGHNVIVNHTVHPQVTDLYWSHPDIVPVIFLNTRSIEEQFEHLRAVRDSKNPANRFNWMQIFDDEQLLRYAKASRFRDMKYREMFIDQLVSFYDLRDYASIEQMHEFAFDSLDAIFLQ